MIQLQSIRRRTWRNGYRCRKWIRETEAVVGCNVLVGALSHRALWDLKTTWINVWHYVGDPPSRQSLCLFWRETRQRVWTRDLDTTGSRQGNARGVGRRNSEKELAKSDAEGQSTSDSRRDQSAWDSVQKQVREDQSRWVGIPSSFVEISRRMHVSVSLHMQRNAECHNLTFLHLS